MLVLASNAGSVARLVLNRPTAGNSLSMEVVSELRDNLAALAAREDIKVIILSGAGGRIFCAGHDLNEFSGQEDQDFLDQFNAAQKEYLGSDDMMAAVAEYGYSEAMLPGDKTTEWVCANR